MKRITDEFDRIYIAKYFDKLGINELATSFEVTTLQLMNVVKELKTKGLYGYYKNMSEVEWENFSGRSKKRQKELSEEGYKKYQKNIR